MSPPSSFKELPQAFPAEARQAVYRAIFERRDMRHFAGGTVQPETLHRLLTAAHYAPSVGFMQPWRFIRIVDVVMRGRLHDAVERERLAKLEGKQVQPLAEDACLRGADDGRFAGGAIHGGLAAYADTLEFVDR